MKTLTDIYNHLNAMQIMLAVLMVAAALCATTILIRNIVDKIYPKKRRDFNRRYGRTL